MSSIASFTQICLFRRNQPFFNFLNINNYFFYNVLLKNPIYFATKGIKRNMFLFFIETTSSQTGVVAGSIGGALVLVTIVLILVIFAHRRYTCVIGNICYHPWWFSMVILLRGLVKFFLSPHWRLVLTWSFNNIFPHWRLVLTWSSNNIFQYIFFENVNHLCWYTN